MKRIFRVIFLLFIFSSVGFSKSMQVSCIEVKEAITPVTQKYIRRAILNASDKKKDALLIILDTPGGLLDSTRKIVQDILAAPIDIIVFVSPSGARAGSAGVFITLAAKYAVMSPGCNIGAAHPVTLGGGSSEKDDKKSNDEILAKKIENDTVAFIKSICEMRGRNKKWAVAAVKESVSITAEEALQKGVVDYLAEDVSGLMKQIYGSKTEYNLSKFPKTWGEKLLTVLANPNLAYLFISLGMLGLALEFRQPGTILPGTLGAFFFVLGMFSNQVLPLNFAGLAMMFLAFVLFILETHIVSYGMLTLAGLISLVIGSAMLFDTPLPFLRVAWSSIVVITGSILGILILAVIFISPIFKQKAVSGKEGILLETGKAVSDFENGTGKVWVHGELWNAASEENIREGDKVELLEVIGLNLKVRKKIE